MPLVGLRNLCVGCDPRGVVNIDFDVPGRTYNVLGAEVFAELGAVLDELEPDAAPDGRVRLVLFRGGKSSGFLAGADLRELAALGDPAAAESLGRVGQEVFGRIERLPVPTVAMIHGPCLGGGLEMALACRFRLARDDDRTQLGAPEVGLGLVPAWGGTQRLPRRIGVKRGVEMILEARKVGAKRAAMLGLTDRAWPTAVFDASVARFVTDRLMGRSFCCRCSRRRLRDVRGKRAQRRVLDATREILTSSQEVSPARLAAFEAIEEGLLQGREAGLRAEQQHFANLLFTPQCREHLAKFLGPKWTGGNLR